MWQITNSCCKNFEGNRYSSIDFYKFILSRHLKVLGALVKQYTPRFLTHTSLLVWCLHLYTTYTTLRDLRFLTHTSLLPYSLHLYTTLRDMLFCLSVRQHFTFSDFWYLSKSIVANNKIIIETDLKIVKNVIGRQIFENELNKFNKWRNSFSLFSQTLGFHGNNANLLWWFTKNSLRNFSLNHSILNNINSGAERNIIVFFKY